MDVVEREVAPHVAHVVAVRTEQLADHALSLPAVRALEVAVLDERHRRVVGPANVVAIGVDFIDQVEDVVGGAPDLAGSDSVRQSTDEPGQHPRDRRRDHDRRERTQPRLVEAFSRERETRDQQRDGEADPRARAGND